MPDPLPRDVDGYVDLDALPEHEVELDLVALAPVEPLPDEVWEVLVSAAPHTDPGTIGNDADALVDGVPTSDPAGTDATQDHATGAVEPGSSQTGADALDDGDGTSGLVGDPAELHALDISDTSDWDI